MTSWPSLGLLVQICINYLGDPKKSQVEAKVGLIWQNKTGRHKQIFSRGNKLDLRTQGIPTDQIPRKMSSSHSTITKYILGNKTP